MEYLIGALVIGGVCALGYSLRCPKCKKWFAKRFDGERVVDEDQYLETVVRQDIHKDNEGRQIGTTDRKEQIVKTRRRIKVLCSCRSCGYKWAYHETRTSEG